MIDMIRILILQKALIGPNVPYTKLKSFCLANYKRFVTLCLKFSQFFVPQVGFAT